MNVIIIATVSGLIASIAAMDNSVMVKHDHESVNDYKINDSFDLPNCPEIYDIHSDGVEYIYPLPHNMKPINQFDLVTNPRSNKHLTVMKRVTD